MTTAIEPSDLEPGTAPGEGLRIRYTVTQIVSAVVECEREIREAFARIEAAEKRLNEFFGCDSDQRYSRDINVRDKWGKVDFGEPDECLREVHRSCWRALVHHLELPRIMSVRAWNELSHKLSNGEPPPIDHETVSGMMRHYHAQIPEMLNEAVIEVFESLRPWYNTYKTNQRFEIGRRVIRENMVDKLWSDGRFPRVHYSRHQDLNALERVFQALDGQGSTSKLHQSELQTAIEKTSFGERGETKYFAFRAFRKGTLHLEFLRLDLLKRLNQVAGGKRLREAADRGPGLDSQG